MAEDFSELDSHAIPFITVSDDGGSGSESKFEINPAAVKYLQSLKGKIAIVAIAGLYRTGKSYLLNALMGKGAGFSVGPTVKACTKGIWLWGKAMEVDGSDTTVLFLDTEGLGSTIRGASYDSRIFALALLLSSFFVYNSTGVIDGDAIGRLSLVVNLTKYIHVQAHAGSGSEAPAEATDSDTSQFFPRFLWVVRDFGVKIERNGVAMSSLEYLEDALKPETGSSESIAQKNSVRALLRAFFPQRDCVTMVRPITDEKLLSKLAEVPITDLRPEFQAQLADLKQRVFNAAQPKVLFGRPVTGSMLASLASIYCDALNANAAPEIRNAWERVAEQQCAQASEAGLPEYRRVMASGLADGPIDAAAVATLHSTATAAAMTRFDVDAVADCDSYTSNRESMLGLLSVEQGKYLRSNIRASEDVCHAAWNTVTDALERKLHSSLNVKKQDGTLTCAGVMKCFSDGVDAARDAYLATAKGPSTHVYLADMLATDVHKVLLPWLTACDAGFQSALSTVEKGYKDNVSSLTAELEVARSASAQVEQLKMELQAARSEVAAITCARDRAVADGVTLSAELSALRSDVSRGRSIDATSPTSTANQAELDAVKAERDRVRLELQESRQQLSRSHASETIDASGLSGINGKLDIVLAMLSAGGRGGKGPEDMSANMFVRKLQTDLSATAGTLSLLQREVEDLRRGGLSTPTATAASMSHEALLLAAQERHAKVVEALQVTSDASQKLSETCTEQSKLLDELQAEHDRAKLNAQMFELEWAGCKAELAQSKGECSALQAEVHVLTSIASTLKRKLAMFVNGLDTVTFDAYVTNRKFEEL